MKKKEKEQSKSHGGDLSREKEGAKGGDASEAINQRNPLIEISSVDLDNIFFPEEPTGELTEREPPSRLSMNDLVDIPTPPPRTPSSPTSKIRVEDATPPPPWERKPQETKPPAPPRKDPRSGQKIPDFRLPKGKIRSDKIFIPPAGDSIGKYGSLDVTKVFVPADRIDEKGKVLPSPPEESTGYPGAVSRKPQPLYKIMLSYGRRIHFRRTIALCSEFLGIAPEVAERRIRYGKGILFEHLDKDTVRDLHRRFLGISQGIRIVKENKSSRIPDPKEVQVWLFSGRHFQVHTEKEKIVLPWKGIRVFCTGNIRLHPSGESYKKVLDAILGNPFVHLRIWDTTFNYKSSGISRESVKDTNFLKLLKTLTRFTKNVRFSPTIKEMLDGNQKEPKRFQSLEEFNNYTRWVYLTFFGEPLRL